MIARFRLRFVGLVIGLAGAAVACERVPLLAPSGSTIVLTTTATTLPVNGTVQIAAQVLEPAGTPPHTGTHISFTTTLGTITPSDIETDINGRAVVTFNAGSASGTATITASSGGATTGSAGAIKIAIGAAAVGRITVNANPGTVPASGGNSAITANVQDSNGNPLSSVAVSFSTDAGSLSAAIVTSDQSGNATTTLATNKTAKVTATTPGTTSTTADGKTTSTPISQTITVNANVASTLTVGAPSPAAPIAGQAVTFSITYTQNASGSPAARIIVDFGDGSPSQTFQGLPSAVSHTYDQPGAYTVRATAIDTFGDTASGSNNVTIAPKPQITVAITPPTNPVAGAAATFSITATPTPGGAITSIVVNFGDGVTTNLSGNASSVSHVYNAGGTYTVSATATDSNGNSGSGSTVIVVVASAGAVFTTSPGSAAHSISFNASASSMPSTITSYQWDFGEPSSGSSNSGSGVTTSHTYTAAGTFTVTLTVTDSAGRTSTAQKTITVS